MTLHCGLPRCAVFAATSGCTLKENGSDTSSLPKVPLFSSPTIRHPWVHPRGGHRPSQPRGLPLSSSSMGHAEDHVARPCPVLPVPTLRRLWFAV